MLNGAGKLKSMKGTLFSSCRAKQAYLQYFGTLVQPLQTGGTACCTGGNELAYATAPAQHLTPADQQHPICTMLEFFCTVIHMRWRMIKLALYAPSSMPFCLILCHNCL